MINESGNRFDIDSLRRPAFYAATLAALGVFGVMLQDLLPLVVMAWVEDVGPHRVHDLNFFAMVWLGLIALALQLYRPTGRVTTVVFPVLVMGPLAVMAVMTGSQIAMLPVLFTALGVVVMALHPAGRSVLRFERADKVDYGLLGLVGVATVPLVGYAATELPKQFAVADEHAALVHYGSMGLGAILIVVLGLLAGLRRRDWRFPAWGAGGLAVYLGASSMAFPGYVSSVGSVWGSLAVVWGVGFVAATEVTRCRTEPVTVERTTYIDIDRDDLWNLINDFDRMTDWVTFADELTYLSDGPVGEGTVYREIGGVGPISSESEWEIREFDPPTRQVHRGDLGIMHPDLTMTLTAVDGGTDFTQTISVRAFPRFRPVGWLLERLVIERAFRSGLEETQANLKRLAESAE